MFKRAKILKKSISGIERGDLQIETKNNAMSKFLSLFIFSKAANFLFNYCGWFFVSLSTGNVVNIILYSFNQVACRVLRLVIHSCERHDKIM